MENKQRRLDVDLDAIERAVRDLLTSAPTVTENAARSNAYERIVTPEVVLELVLRARALAAVEVKLLSEWEDRAIREIAALLHR